MKSNRLGLRFARVLVCALLLVVPASVAWSAPSGVLAALEAAPIVVVAEVERVTRLAHGGYQADLKITRSLPKGRPAPESLTVAWEEPVPSLPPRFKRGERILVAVGSLPTASIWRIRVPDAEVRGRLFGLAQGGEGYLSRPTAGELDVIEHYLLVDGAARKGDAGAFQLASLCAAGQPRIATDAAARLAGFDKLSEHLLPGAARAIVDALLRPEMGDATSLLLEMIGAARPTALGSALEERIRRLGPPVPPVLYAALGALEGQLADVVLETLLDSKSSEARTTAARHAGGEGARELLRGLVRTDLSPKVRSAAITRLATLDGALALPEVTRALEDPAGSVRFAAAQAAAGLGPTAVGSLRSVAIHDSSDAARAAIAALSLMGREAYVVLTEMEASHPDEAMRLLARIALGQPIGDRH